MRTASRVLKSAHSARQLPASLTPRSSLRPFRSLSGLAHSSRPSIRPCTTPIALTLPRQLLSTTSPLRNESKPKEELKDEPKQEEIELEYEIDEDLSERKWSTPLAKTIAEAIEVTGPIPLASYMRMCLTADLGGYYTGALPASEANPERDPFGAAGDFVTSPEISQVFGELCGVWFVAEWMAQGRPATGVELMELGPGRGTLMDDMLRTMQRFPGIAKALERVYLVEASPQLRQAQKRLLCGDEAVLEGCEVGWKSRSKYGGVEIVWTESIRAVPMDPSKTPFIIAHEFFDALPIHAFQLVSVPASSDAKPSPIITSVSSPTPSPPQNPNLQWRELLVSPTPPGSTHASLNTPLSERSSPVPDFQLTLSPSPTKHSLYLPDSTPRYRRLKSLPPQQALNATIEICPDLFSHTTNIAHRIGGHPTLNPKPHPSGAALILDYGPGDGSIPTSTLRGIRRHRRVSPFSEPGLVDLSADVDFQAIVDTALDASEGVEVHGPVEQAFFLRAMGIAERAGEIVKKVEAMGDQKKKGDVERAWQRLVDRGPGGMGRVYKALAIVPEAGGRRRPVGFGGDVVV